jgi:hypothetical protein
VSHSLTECLPHSQLSLADTVSLKVACGPAGLSLARARELCIDAKRAIKKGRSPAIEKQREKRPLLESKSFGELGGASAGLKVDIIASYESVARESV